MYRQENLSNLNVNICPQTDRFNLTSEQRKRFAKQLRFCLIRLYDGKLPSYSAIARDFCLRSPGGETISGESIRKWITGRALPHSHRLSVLIDWLGIDLASSLSNSFDASKSNLNSNDKDHIQPQSHSTSGNGATDLEITHLTKTLSDRDRQLVLSILKTMQHSRTEK